MPPAGFVMSHPTCKNSPGHPPSGQGFLCMTWEWVGRGPNQFVHSSTKQLTENLLCAR